MSSVPDPNADRDEFDRIVEGLDLDVGDPAEFDAVAARAAADRERADRERREREAEQRAAAEAAAARDEQFYRDVEPVSLPRDRRVTIAWTVLLAGPALLLGSVLLAVRPPTTVTGALILASAGAVVYLLARLPDRGPSNPDWPDDGAAL